MNRLPKIGERVAFSGSSVVGPCVGVVKAIYPSHVPAPGQDEEDDDCRYVQGPFDPEHWHVGVEVEGDLPTPFVYTGARRFAPAIANIEPAQLNKEAK
jgi:phage baseplate assembly protein gpV